MSKYDSIIILGPTGSGKTELSLMLAKKLCGEIVNADSMQVYKLMNIGTAKVTDKEKEIVNHYLFDLVYPNEDYTVADYKIDAKNVITVLKTKHVVPIIVGGTGFYIQSLLYDYDYGNAIKNENVRKKYLDLCEKFGNEYIFDELKKVDPESCKKLHFNDTKRVIRALEIYETTGQKKSEIDNIKESGFIKPLIIGLNYPREILYERINIRVDLMVDAGLLKEVESLLKDYNKNDKGMQGIGYKELIPYFNGEENLNNCIEKIKQNTRNYAKRQITWFKKQQNIIWFDKSQESVDEIFKQVLTAYLSE